MLNTSRTQGRVMGQDAIKSLYWMSVNNEDAGRPRLTYSLKGGWNETKWMSVEKWWNDIYGMEKREKLREKPIQTPFVHHKTHMKWPRRELGTPAVGGECLTACAKIIYLFYRSK